jgi:hypothetical protein
MTGLPPVNAARAGLYGGHGGVDGDYGRQRRSARRIAGPTRVDRRFKLSLDAAVHKPPASRRGPDKRQPIHNPARVA